MALSCPRTTARRNGDEPPPYQGRRRHCSSPRKWTLPAVIGIMAFTAEACWWSQGGLKLHNNRRNVSNSRSLFACCRNKRAAIESGNWTLIKQAAALRRSQGLLVLACDVKSHDKLPRALKTGCQSLPGFRLLTNSLAQDPGLQQRQGRGKGKI